MHFIQCLFHILKIFKKVKHLFPNNHDFALITNKKNTIVAAGVPEVWDDVITSARKHPTAFFICIMKCDHMKDIKLATERFFPKMPRPLIKLQDSNYGSNFCTSCTKTYLNEADSKQPLGSYDSIQVTYESCYFAVQCPEARVTVTACEELILLHARQRNSSGVSFVPHPQRQHNIPMRMPGSYPHDTERKPSTTSISTYYRQPNKH
ncbi:hypothetical protein PR048_008969 [Dryococelus australis]|uniref:Uncharacterized protein n=1 Tax=Dryococelus australis TaxID=614101 RepID=A0ABQ9HYL6_9NEOP|nr:hypothetical protein PR048_008969 [Dryococelus australis]